jgi:glycosyl transferase family 25
MVSEKIETALVFEDDAILHEDFTKVIETLLNAHYPWELVRFLGSPKVARLRQRKIEKLYNDFYLTRLSTAPGGAHAYLIRLSAAQKLIKATEKTAYPIDTIMGRGWDTGLDVLTVQPGLAIQDLGFESAIGDERHDKKNYDVRGTARIFFPLTRSFYKISDAVMKKITYYKYLFSDRFFYSKNK